MGIQGEAVGGQGKGAKKSASTVWSIFRKTEGKSNPILGEKQQFTQPSRRDKKDACRGGGRVKKGDLPATQKNDLSLSTKGYPTRCNPNTPEKNPTSTRPTTVHDEEEGAKPQTTKGVGESDRNSYSMMKRYLSKQLKRLKPNGLNERERVSLFG